MAACGPAMPGDDTGTDADKSNHGPGNTTHLASPTSRPPPRVPTSRPSKHSREPCRRNETGLPPPSSGVEARFHVLWGSGWARARVGAGAWRGWRWDAESTGKGEVTGGG